MAHLVEQMNQLQRALCDSWPKRVAQILDEIAMENPAAAARIQEQLGRRDIYEDVIKGHIDIAQLALDAA